MHYTERGPHREVPLDSFPGGLLPPTDTAGTHLKVVLKFGTGLVCGCGQRVLQLLDGVQGGPAGSNQNGLQTKSLNRCHWQLNYIHQLCTLSSSLA